MIPITPLKTDGLVLSEALLESRIAYDREWWRYDVRVSRIHSRKLTDGVCCEAELFSEEELARNPFRQEFCRDYGLGAFAAQLVMPLPNFVVAFSVQRAAHLGHFERRELDTLALIGKHAARALLISTHLTQARKIEHTVANALAQLECAALIVDREMKVVVANAASERLLGDGLCIHQGQLLATSSMHQQSVARLIHAALRGDAAADDLETIALPRPSGKKPLLVQAVPASPGSAMWSAPSGAAALVIVVDPERGERFGLARELRLLGLTASEARLAGLIGSGVSRAEAAETLRISATTVDDTIKQIYSKLDIARVGELVRLVDRLAVFARRRRERP
ncbi:MAG: helix-turn-helix transcriptional regulator [Methyloceanibacter sp.]|uniref:helix-turn-helix transcriptional regulator n=1 Tax=Methyloceanibacter sp. TaxID=1965321 RepID=UPI003D6D6762